MELSVTVNENPVKTGVERVSDKNDGRDEMDLVQR